MLRFGRTAAVAAPQDLLSGAQSFHDRIGDGDDLLAIARRVEQTLTIGEQLVEAAPTFIIYGSIQNRS